MHEQHTPIPHSRRAQDGTTPAAPEPLTFFAYSRVSTEEQADHGVSLDAQGRDNRAYVVKVDGRLGGEFQDVLTGRRSDRPGYQELLAAVRAAARQGPTAVVVPKLDRLGRDLEEFTATRKQLRALGVKIHYARDGGLLANLNENLQMVLAEHESERLGERVRDARRTIREAGWFPNGRPPWGYRWRDATPEERLAHSPHRVIEPNPAAADFVREAYERLAGGTSLRQVASWVHELPTVARGGRRFAFDDTRRTLTSPIYIARPYGTTVATLPEAPLQRWQPLISDELWLAVQAEIASHRLRPHQASGQYLLSGFLRCPRCGSRCGSGQGRVPRYECNRSRALPTGCRWSARQEWFDPIVRAALTDILEPLYSTDSALLPGLEAAWDRLRCPPEEAPHGDRIASLEQHRQLLHSRHQSLLDKYADDRLDFEDYRRARDRYVAEEAAIQATLRELRGAPPGPVAPLPELGGVRAEAARAPAVLQMASVPELRRLLTVWVERVELAQRQPGAYEVRVVWSPLGAAVAAAILTCRPRDDLTDERELAGVWGAQLHYRKPGRGSAQHWEWQRAALPAVDDVTGVGLTPSSSGTGQSPPGSSVPANCEVRHNSPPAGLFSLTPLT